MLRQQLETSLRSALDSLGVPDTGFRIDYPPGETGADFSTNAALAAGKALGKPPREVARELVEKLGAIEGIEKIEVAPPGFLNFTLARATHARTVETARKDGWGSNDTEQGKKMLVEYTDPNPFKEFHIGHLMSNAYGESIARLLLASGAEVKRANYQGDVGPHVAKCLFALLEKGVTEPTLEDLSRAYVEGARRYEENAGDKAAIDALNKTIYEKTDATVQALYEKGRKISLDHFEALYKILGTTFDFYFFESETAPRGLKIVKAHPEIFEESDGAIVFRGEKYGLHTRVFVTSQGLPTYEAKDLGLAQAKEEKWDFDSSLTITANEQDGYFKVVFKAAELALPELAHKLMHRSHGMMRFAEGKMSSRRGNVITGESLLSDMREEARARMGARELADPEAVADAIAVSAIKYAVLRQGSGKDIVFDPQQSLSLEGDSGPYIQYAHTRCASILQKAKEEGVTPDASKPTAEASAVEKLLIRFPEAIARAAKELEPHYVAQYLLLLASAFNSWYAAERVLGTPEAPYKLAVVDAVGDTIKKGLYLLGIQAPEEM